MKEKKGLIFFSLGSVALMVGLIVTYAGQVSLLYLKTDEVLSRLERSASANTKTTKSLVGQHLRIHGKLKPKTTKRRKGRLDYEFHIQGKSGRSILVNYSGILPDTFRDGAELVVEGQLVKSNLFVAKSVFAKCPTKYKEEKKGGGGGYTKKKTSS